ncbi:MAG: Sensor protein [uncultured bacterium (gcode 4)]|uniref:histidine kinase n=1 Tax=uncultured bacterium (gcode 4) TaxID=1234023 RepID=K2H2J8_9BACT|nr:MAG: Sensor protein [uncultured bacterium (gcode 4)]
MLLNKIIRFAIKSKQSNLAIKISSYVFFLLTLSFSLLITIYHFQSTLEEKRSFETEANILSQSSDFPKNLIKRDFDWVAGQADRINMNELHDYMIISNSWAYYNWVFGVIDRGDIKKRVGSDIEYIDFWSSTYMMMRLRSKDMDVYIAKDATRRIIWERQIIFTAAILDILLMFLIYFLSRRLSLLAIEPIQQMNKKLKDYNHNLAHELKTPISVIKSDLELSRISWESLDFPRTIDELRHLEDIVNSLLVLSEVWNVDKKDIMLWVTTKKILDRLKKIYKIKSEKIKFNIQKDFTVNTNEKLLDILLKNILENSLKYSIENTPITIKISPRTLVVSNTGKNISKEELDNLFQPFFKGSNSVAWYWLWLNIVKTIADQNSWELNFTANKDYYTFEVKFSQ